MHTRMASVAALAIPLPVLAAALVAGQALLASAGVAALIGKRQVGAAAPIAQQTVANVKDDILEVKDASHDHT
jgi:hypothetical protein